MWVCTGTEGPGAWGTAAGLVRPQRGRGPGAWGSAAGLVGPQRGRGPGGPLQGLFLPRQEGQQCPAAGSLDCCEGIR